MTEEQKAKLQEARKLSHAAGTDGPIYLKRWSPIKAIRAKCMDCSCGSSEEVKQCPVSSCPLYEYRFGTKKKSKYASQCIKNPATISDEDFIEDSS